MIVVDVGAAEIGHDHSIGRLAQMFRPGVIWAIDPNWPEDKPVTSPEGTTVNLLRAAAWTRPGEVGWGGDGLTAHVDESSTTTVPCFDLAEFLEALPEGPVILKIDAEGAEYELLEHLLATGAVARLTRLLIEWHPRGEGKRRHEIEMALRRHEVVVEQWRW